MYTHTRVCILLYLSVHLPRDLFHWNWLGRWWGLDRQVCNPQVELSPQGRLCLALKAFSQGARPITSCGWSPVLRSRDWRYHPSYRRSPTPAALRAVPEHTAGPAPRPS